MVGITHTFVSGKPDDTDTTLVRPSNWNADHVVAGLEAETSIWYHEHLIIPSAIVKGASAATFVAPDANTLGGWRIDGATEYLYFWSHIEDDWDGISDIAVHVMYEVNVNNTGGADADTVDLQLVCHMKEETETSMKTQTLEVAKVVGKSTRYNIFETEFYIDYNDGSNPVHPGDIIGFILNIETDTSEVDDIVIILVEVKYKTRHPAPLVSEGA